MPDVCKVRAQQFAAQLTAEYGPPLDVANIREVGWRKLASGKTALLYQWDVVRGDPDEKPDFVLCPKCNAMMVLKTPRKGQTWKPFMGCTKYPDCKGTRRV